MVGVSVVIVLIVSFWVVVVFGEEPLLKSSVVGSGKGPLVSIRGQGDVVGLRKKSRNGRDYVAYLGIPYAEVPQRFQNPRKAIKSWEGVRDGTIFGSECIQLSWTTGKASGSEDCLFLNVFRPQVTPLKPLTTIVFIHGGGFQGGNGGNNGVEYFMDQDLLFVTFNYRLGPLGFLNTGDGAMDGNVGLKDQSVAISWVRDNIASFGGDAKSITIFGGSAGAASVSYHLISPMSRGLFQRAISGSGSAECPWAYDPNPRVNAQSLAQQLNCPTTNSRQMINCFKEKEAAEFVGKNFTKFGWSLDGMSAFVPSKEFYEESPGINIFLSDDPTSLLDQGQFSKVPWLTGATRNEGLALHSTTVLANPEHLKLLNEKWNDIAPITFGFEKTVPKSDWVSVGNRIREFYFGDEEISKETGDALERLYSDCNFFQGIRNTILAHARHNATVYPYFFDYKGETTSWLETVYNVKTTGVAHADDFAFYFKFYMDPNNPDSGMDLDPKDLEISQNLIKFLVSFAETGKPNGVVLGDVSWPATTEVEGTGRQPLGWFHLDGTPSWSTETQDFAKRMKFWNDISGNSAASSSRSEL